jgi:NDP-sugar pyrophosphorylase family protein
MKAMVLAAGLGTRLRPLTNGRPKALVEVADRTMLEITLARLRSFGIREVIVNVHHFADLVVDYLRANDNFGMRVEISREEVLLDTGGGLKKAGWFFRDSGDEPFILHNVDVVSTIDLGRMVRFHQASEALATLAVQDRQSSRYLLFNQERQLRGRRVHGNNELVPTSAVIAAHVRTTRTQSPEQVLEDTAVAAAALDAWAFCGVHVIAPRIFELMAKDEVFSIITAYLNLAAQGEKLVAFDANEYCWRDLGTPESVAQAALQTAQLAIPQR